MTAVALPTKPQKREDLGITPMNARIFLLGVPKVGKSTLAASWAPEKTLFIDTQHGTDMLAGEHYVQHVSNWQQLESVVDLLAAGDHRFETVIIDTVDDAYKFCDAHVAASKGQVAAGLIDYGKGTAEAEGLFRRALGKLLATGYGLWFVGHADMVDVNKVQKYVPVLDKRVRNYVTGACGFIFIAERTGPNRILHTQPSERFEAGSRVTMPEPLEMNARKLYAAMLKGLKQSTNGSAPAAVKTNKTKEA